MNSASPNPAPEISSWRNWISLSGLVIALGSFFSFLLLFAIDLMSRDSNPYLGILTFVVAPGFLVLGLVLMGGGWLFQRRLRVKALAGGLGPLLSIDVTNPRHRRNLVVFAFGAAVFLLFSAIGSYRTYHFAESVQFCGQTCHPSMTPELTAYHHSPHARVACTECHIGPGAASFVKAKLNGVHQLYATILNHYPRPIQTPKNLEPAQKTCERCHWPKRYVGSLDRVYHHFLSDETNTPTSFQLLLKVGGGDPTHGPVGGIHWHMNLANTIEYIATDERHQVIPWVRLTNFKGEVTEYRAANFKEDPAKYAIHRMDCMDCHNRPAHQFHAPNDAVDLAMALGKIDPTLPFIKSNLVAVLTRTHTTQAEAVQTIASTLRSFYPNEPKIGAVIAEAHQIYTNNFFPEMKADWRAYPNNIGHKNWPGCFRCHDGQHKTADGNRKIEASDCNDCHTILGQGSGAQAEKLYPQGQKFVHPDPVSEGTDRDCYTCHSSES